MRDLNNNNGLRCTVTVSYETRMSNYIWSHRKRWWEVGVVRQPQAVWTAARVWWRPEKIIQNKTAPIRVYVYRVLDCWKYHTLYIWYVRFGMIMQQNRALPGNQRGLFGTQLLLYSVNIFKVYHRRNASTNIQEQNNIESTQLRLQNSTGLGPTNFHLFLHLSNYGI